MTAACVRGQEEGTLTGVLADRLRRAWTSIAELAQLIAPLMILHHEFGPV
jgi:hypothetical protein